MIQYPPWPVLGGGPRISGAVVALATDDTTITPPGPGQPFWTDGVGWDPLYWAACWAEARGDLQSLYELPWGDLQDKLYWYITAPEDPEAAGAPDYLTPAQFFLSQFAEYLSAGP